MHEINIAIVAILISIIIVLLYLFKKNQNSFKSFLDIQKNILVLATDAKIIYINKAGLEFFGFKNTKEFIAEYNNIPNIFIEDDSCFSKYSIGKKWLTNLYNNKNNQIKVKLRTEPNNNIEYYFYIQISKLKRNHYLLSFTNITKLEREKDLIRKLADYDALTHIYSRVKFNEIFPIYIDRRDRYNEIFSIILFDIDHFKRINDTQGHNVGDIVLKDLTTIIRNKLKELKMGNTTLFSRWGGEEFVILVQFLKKEEAGKIANILRKDISKDKFVNNSIEVTCSFGVTEVKAQDTQVDIFRRVDEALYEAKDKGRNQVVIK
ncbi:MAG: GGDEF domain-containing protein [Sulfurovaceae bacterium]|nr:GGDEF domain-containing protein [Sulfurovaceae bacterium]